MTYPSSPQTLVSRLRPVKLSLGNNTQTIAQKPRVMPSTSGVSQSSFGGTIPILALPSVTQGIKRLPVVTPGGNRTVFFLGKRS